MLYEGELAEGEANLVCKSQDWWHHPYQSDARGDGDNKIFDNFVSRETEDEIRVDRSMEVERH